MKKFKRYAALIAAVVIAFSGIYIDIPQVYAADSTKDFTITNGVLTQYNGTNKATVTIPNGVTRIADEVFIRNNTIENVIIPDSVTTIGDRAFYECKSLTSVEFGNGIRNIGWDAFKSCSDLVSVDLSDTKLKVVPRGAFAEDKSLTDVSLPDTVEVIGQGAFSHCEHLGRINLPEGVESIQAYAFENCWAINSIDLPDTLTYIGNSAFNGMRTLSSISIPGGVKTIGNYAFTGDYSLKNIYLPDSVEYIGKKALDTYNGVDNGHGSLTSIYVPSSVVKTYDNWLDLTTNSGQSGVSVIKGEKDSYAHKYVEEYNSNIYKKYNGNDTSKYELTFTLVSKDCTVKFNSNGSSAISDKKCCKGGNFGTLPTPKLKGYTFKGWYSDTSFTKRVKSSSIVKKDNYTLYAK